MPPLWALASLLRLNEPMKWLLNEEEVHFYDAVFTFILDKCLLFLSRILFLYCTACSPIYCNLWVMFYFDISYAVSKHAVSKHVEICILMCFTQCYNDIMYVHHVFIQEKNIIVQNVIGKFFMVLEYEGFKGILLACSNSVLLYLTIAFLAI